MEPVTIPSLASGSAAVGRSLFRSAESLWKFIEQARDVDQAIRDLTREVTGLSRTLTSIRDALDQAAVRDHRTIAQDYVIVWDSLDGSLRDCNVTATAMQAKLEGLQSSKRVSFLSQAWKHYRLGFKEEEITSLRSQILTHSTGLHLSLLMINVITSITTPDRVIESIWPRFDQLAETIEDLQSVGGQLSVQNELFQPRTQQLQRAAQAVLSSAGNVIGDSKSTESITGNIQDMTELEIGTTLNSKQRERLQRWISPPSFEEALNSLSLEKEDSEKDFIKSEEKGGMSEADSETTISVPQTTITPYSEGEDNLELEISQRLFAQAQRRYQLKNYVLARQCLTQVVEKTKRLSPRSRRKLGVAAVKLLFAQAYLEMNKNGNHCIAMNSKGEYTCGQKSREDLETCETLLLDLSRSSAKELEELRVDASYTLCQVYSHQHRQKEAYDLCRKTVSALKAQQSTLRSWKSAILSHDATQGLQYTLCLELLSQICKNRGDLTEATAYDELLEEQPSYHKPGNYQKPAAENSTTGADRYKLEGYVGEVSDVKSSATDILKPPIYEPCENTAILWTSSKQVERYTLEGHSNIVYCVAISPDGTLVASASFDSTVIIWDVATRSIRHTLTGHSMHVYSVGFSPDGKMVASASTDRTIRLWDAASGASLWTSKDTPGIILELAFSPDGRLLAFGFDNQIVMLWDVAKKKERRSLKGHSGPVRGIAFSPDGTLVASAGSTDYTVRLWNPDTGTARFTLKGHSGDVYAVAFSPDSKLVASGCHDHKVRVWDSTTGAVRHTITHDTNLVLGVTFSPDGRLVASVGYGVVRLWDIEKGVSLPAINCQRNTLWSVAFSPDGRVIVIGSGGTTAMLLVCNTPRLNLS